MAKASVLYLGEQREGKCLQLPLSNFLQSPRLFDNADSFPRGRYQGPAVLVLEECDEHKADEIRNAILELLRPECRDSYPWDMTQLLLNTRDSKMPDYIRHTTSDDLWSVIKYRGKNDYTQEGQEWLAKNEGQVDLNELPGLRRRINRLFGTSTRVATWLCCEPRLAIGERSVRLTALVVLVFDNKPHRSRSSARSRDCLATRLQEHLGPVMGNGIAQAIEKHPLTIYVYLYSCFNNFSSIVKCYEYLFKIATSLQGGYSFGVPERSLLLNRGLVQISFGLPDILQHRAVLRQLRNCNKRRGNDEGHDVTDVQNQLEQFFVSMTHDIDDFDRHVDMFCQRFQSSLELEFNISDEKMNWVMMWFTFVAIIFTPMAFVAVRLCSHPPARPRQRG
ncbi:hypothetical protein B0H67DRAFT_586272 [Lasiosphaeris hirsuta]|uniref:Uncharacterized protein n=1 Tax=Lasiosphaeris hirsuta TaxID=260670 RepID=A0AA40A9J2_9PEZI|nr:hypothetical protein B0H67DRAFT_586272 [Lasiosphaeris hirsuta]